MALITCEECKKEISDSVKNCPLCGFSLARSKKIKRSRETTEKWNNTSKSHKSKIKLLFLLLFLFILFYIVIVAFIASASNSSPSTAKLHYSKEMSKEDAFKYLVQESCISALDGRNYMLEKYIKMEMNDPSSYKVDHDYTRVWVFPKTNRYVSQLSFFGKNAFGGTVRNQIKKTFKISDCTVETKK